jgi:glycine/D-amino acid oxidase-like deaminating enzyme
MPASRTVLVLGAGMVAMGCAWLLQRRGHAVTLVAADYDVPLLPPQGACGGSQAALGVQMGNVFHRRSGRAWHLRQRSVALWSLWRQQLAERGHQVPWRPGLLLLAADAAERQRLERLERDPKGIGLGIRLLNADDLAGLTPPLPGTGGSGAGSLWGGLFSPWDGQIDPLAALSALRRDALAAGMVGRAGLAGALEQRPGGWRLQLDGGGTLDTEWLVLAAGCGTNALLAPLLHHTATPLEASTLEPVLGQALELELEKTDATLWQGWPGAVVWRGMNLVPRPDLPGGRRFWLGATVEPGSATDPQALDRLRTLEGNAPTWLQRAKVVRHWHGLRPRPVGRPAPLLEELAPRLLLASGHHRNGVLLTPASAAWVCDRVESTESPGAAPAKSPPCGGP